MDGVVDRERPASLFVYVDETVRELADGRKLLGAGALIVTQEITRDAIERAMTGLRADPDRDASSPRFKFANEKRDARTLERGFFHASEDSMNARSFLSREIKAGEV